MFNHRGLGVYGPVRVIAALGLVLAANSALLCANDASSPSLYEIVAVGRGRGRLLLATLAAPAEKREWRFREIRLPPSDSTAREAVLSFSGTKALVVFSDGTPRVFDLTKRITEITPTDMSPPQHRLARQVFPYAANGKVCLLNDLANLDDDKCVTAAAAAVHEDGRVLYALTDGRLVVFSPTANVQQRLPYQLPQNSHFELLAGHKGDALDFLALVTAPPQYNAGSSSVPVTEIVDPRIPMSLARFTNPTMAALQAQLEFANPPAEALKASRPEQLNDAHLSSLVAHLDRQTAPGEFTWSFFRVVANTELYAPVLEFAPGEPAYPSDVDIWQEIRPLAHGTTRQAYEAAYASMGDRRWSRCTAYVRTLSFPGTWLIEYWFYYPFDEGRPNPHMHDSEHIFVEVDKLGGTVRNFFASDHDSFVPNDLYSTLVRDAPPIKLPLFAMVEFGKHAMAPDLNHDGRFTRGVGDNLHPESYSFWGLRDHGTKFHFLMEPYRASMSVPRRREDRFSLKDANSFFRELDVPLDHQTCSVQPFPDDPPCVNCDIANAEAAITHLVDHPDARNAENIYKPYVIPWREVRLGVGIYDWREGRAQLSIGVVGDIRHMTGGLLPVPARLALEYMWSPRGINVAVPGQQQFTYSRSTMWAGARLERLVTNTQGFYFAATPEWADISSGFVNGISAAPHWQYTGVSYHAGYLLELPSAHKGNLTNHVGAVFFPDAPAYRLLFEWRVSLGFLRRRGRHDFGASAGDRNPYQ